MVRFSKFTKKKKKKKKRYMRSLKSFSPNFVLLLSCPYSQLPLSLLYLLKFMGFLHFVPQAVPTTFGFLWASLQDYPLTQLLFDHYFYSKGACHTTLHFQTKVLVLFLSHSLPCLPQWIKVEGFLYLLLWHASSGPNLCLPLLGKMSSQQSIFPKEVLVGTLEQISFL